MPRGKRNPTAAVVGQPRNDFKVRDIKEEALIESVSQRSGIKDPEVNGFIKSVIPRYSDWSASQAIKSMSNMAKEFAKPGSTGSSGNSGEQRAQANGEPTAEQRRRPGRPKGSRNKPQGGSDKGQAAGGKRGPGRPKGSGRKSSDRARA